MEATGANDSLDDTSSFLRKLSWVTMYAYAVGVIVARGFDSMWNVPGHASAPLIDIGHLLFGFACVGLLAAMLWCAMLVSSVHPLDRIGENFARYEETFGRSRTRPLFYAVQFIVVVVPTIGLPLALPSAILLAMLGQQGMSRHPSAIVALIAIQSFFILTALESRQGAKPKERYPIQALLAPVMGGARVAEGVYFLSAYFLTALLLGVALYPVSAPAIGGGRGVDVELQFRVDSGPSRGERLQLIRFSPPYALVSDTGEHGFLRRVYLLREDTIAAIRPAPR